MRFAHPQILLLLLPSVLLLAGFLVWAWHRKQRLIRLFVQERLLAQLTAGVSWGRQKARMVLVGVAVVCSAVALARPQWGFGWEEAHQRGLDIVVAIDTSRSMLADDLRPNRLERARLAALDLMRLARSDRLALVPFAGTAFLQCPLTLDAGAFQQNVQALEVGIMPQGGTVLNEAIEVALAAFKDSGENTKVLVLLTDGEDHEGNAVAGAEEAARQGLHVFTVGVGTTEGEVLRERDESGNLVYVRDAGGEVVKSRLNQALLQEVATAGNGFYLPLQAGNAMETLYEQGLSGLTRSEVAARLYRRYHERYHWPLGAAILLLAIEPFFVDRTRRARRALATTNPKPAARAAILGIWLLGACLVMGADRGLRNYDAGRYDQARETYDKLLERRPEDPRLLYNSGTAAYQAQDYTNAIRGLQSATRAPDLELQQRAFYNLGDALYRQGEQVPDRQSRQDLWQQSVESFDAALKLNPQDVDAEFNLNFVKRKIEELEEPPPQDSQQSPGPESNAPEESDGSDKSDESSTDPSEPSEQPSSGASEQGDESEDTSAGQSEQSEGSEQSEPQDPPGQSGSQQPSAGDAGGGGTEPDGRPPQGGMTRQEAQQMLDAARQEERPLIFQPHEQVRNRARNFKDW
jgi:Ca-activated chloride channel family protein